MLWQPTSPGLMRRGAGSVLPIDANIASVVFLSGFEGADGSTTISDESTAANKGNGTAVGNAQIDTAQFKFGASSLLLDGTGDYVTWADHANFHLSGANSDLFTIEFWMRRAATGNLYVMGQGDGSGSMGWYVTSNFASSPSASDVVFVFSLTGGLAGNLVLTSTGNITLNINEWYFVAIGKNASGKIRIHIGQSDTATMRNSNTPASSVFFDSPSVFNLGRANSSAAVWNGWLDEVRITKGVCRHDTDGTITVPTAAFPRN